MITKIGFMDITFRTDLIPPTQQVIGLYNRAGLPRPTGDYERMHQLLEQADLIVSAWDGEKLIGISRTITDWVWSAYLADLAVDPDHERSGIGKRLVGITRSRLEGRCMLLLLSVPTAMEYYPKIGFNHENRAFSIDRDQ